MSTITVTDLICDYCGTERGEIETHTVIIDREEVTAELCAKDLKRFTDLLDRLRERGVKVTKHKRQYVRKAAMNGG